MVRRAGEGDLGFMMATERIEAYALQVGRWSEPRHRASLADPSFAYLIGEKDGGPIGFAILRTLNDPNDNVGLQRIAVASPGQGLGGELLTRVTDWVFTETACHRFLLEVFTDNIRARRVYARRGFVEEGVLRQVVKRLDGTRADQVLMSLLRPEWQAARARSTP